MYYIITSVPQSRLDIYARLSNNSGMAADAYEGVIIGKEGRRGRLGGTEGSREVILASQELH